MIIKEVSWLLYDLSDKLLVFDHLVIATLVFEYKLNASWGFVNGSPRGRIASYDVIFTNNDLEGCVDFGNNISEHQVLELNRVKDVMSAQSSNIA